MGWDNKDDQAYGSILLCVNPSVAVLAASSTTAMAAWVALRAAFGQTSVVESCDLLVDPGCHMFSLMAHDEVMGTTQ